MDERRASRATWAALRIDLQTAEVAGALQHAGISVLLLKGPSTARWLYTDGAPRPYGDSDLLVHPAEHAQARRVLLDLGFRDLHDGFRSSERNPHADTFARPSPGGPGYVDLHHRVELTNVAAPAAFTTWWSHRSASTVAGAPVMELDLVARCVVLALHAVQSGYADGKALDDLRRARAVAPDTSWSTAQRLASRLGSETELDLALAMIEMPLRQLRATSAWARADPALRGRIMRTEGERGARALLQVTSSPGWRRPLLALGQVLPSKARLRSLYGGDGSYATLAGRHAAAVVGSSAAAWRAARRATSTGS